MLLEAYKTHKVPLCLPDPGDSTCQLMISYVLLTPKMLRFSVQFLILQDLAIATDLHV